MLKILKIKEKQSILINILYIILLVIFTLTLITSYENQSTSSTNHFGILIYFAFITEMFRHSMFNISYFFQKSVLTSYFTPSRGGIRNNLFILSIKYNQLIKLNILYTLVRLLPLWIILILVNIVIGIDSKEFLYLAAFSGGFILKAYIGPVHSKLTGFKIESYIENKDLPKNEKRQKGLDVLSSEYINFDQNKHKKYELAFLLSYLIILFYGYVLLFPFVFKSLTITTPLMTILLVSGLSTILIYGRYINQLESRREHELYKE